jgi:pimeloyl-ACP methyl ester carboxylesterase
LVIFNEEGNRMLSTALKLTVTAALTTAVLPAALPASAGAPAGGTTVALSSAAAAPQGVDRIPWHRCRPEDPKTLQCATVTVPLDWSRPQGKQIRLAVIRLRGSDQKHRIGSVFLNPGGPGESGVGLVRDAGAFIDEEWTKGRYDLVGWDPRGTNASTSVTCFSSAAEERRFWGEGQLPNTPAEGAAYAKKLQALTQKCRRLSGDLLQHISTADTARDLDRLRQNIGDPKLNYIGLSYGTEIGQTYANLFPGKVRAMLLDAVLDPKNYTTNAESRFGNTAPAADPVFAQLLALCQGAGPQKCALANHPESVADRVGRLFARVKKAPLPAPYASPPGVLTYADLLFAVYTPIRDPNTWPQFAKDLDAAANGDGSALESTARQLRTPEVLTKATVSAAIQCNDSGASQPLGAWPSVIGRFEKSGSLYGRILGWWLWAPCAAKLSGPAPGRYAGPWTAKTTTPILMLNNVYDPATGYSGARQAERLAGNAVLLTVAGYGHPSYQLESSCADRARVRYLLELKVPPRGTVCAADAPFTSTGAEPPIGEPEQGF